MTLGWAIGSHQLTAIVPGWIAPQPLAVLGLALGSTSLAGAAADRRSLAVGAGALLALLNLVLLAAYALKADLPIDLMLFRDAVLHQLPMPLKPGRPSVIACVMFTTLGGALCLSLARSATWRLGSVTLATAVLAAALHAFLGTALLEGNVLQHLPMAAGISVHLAVGVAALSLGVLLVRRETGWIRFLVGAGEDATLARRLTPVTLIPVVVALLANIGVRTNAYGRDARMLIIVEISVAALLVLQFWTARWLGRERGARGDLARAMDLSPSMVRSIDGVIEYWPRGCEALYGWTAAEAVGKRAQDLLKIKANRPLDEIIATLRRDGEWTGELTKVTKSGDTRVVAARWILQDRGAASAPRLVESVTDITALKATTDALRDSEARMAEAVEAYGLGIADFNPVTQRLTVSPQMERILGVGPGELDGDMGLWESMVPLEDRAGDRASFEADLADHVDRREFRHRIIRPDGEIRVLQGVRRMLYGAGGELQRVIALHMDVTQQVADHGALTATTDALRDSESRLSQAVETFGLGIGDYDPTTQQLAVSRELELIAGVGPGELDGDLSRWRSMVPLEDQARIYADLDADVASAAKIRNFRHRLIRADGEIRILQGVRRFTYSPSGEWLRAISIYMDVTQQVADHAEVEARGARLMALQSELTHVSRLSAMGEMAAALAHELNQPLTAVGNSVGAIGMIMGRQDRPIDEAMRGRIVQATTQAEAQAVRAGEIVRRLREFVVRGEVDSRIEELDSLIDDAAALALPNPAAAGVEVRRTTSAEPAFVLADRVQIQQIIVNLVRNAVEAMCAQTTPRVLGIAVETDHDTARVSISDTGPGVAPEMAEHLFAPFRSTKTDGMGVGLSICRRIVEAHGGTLWLEQPPGSGATFRFTLPLVTKDMHDG